MPDTTEKLLLDIKTELATFRAEMGQRVGQNEKDTQRLSRKVEGNNGQPGIDKRLDRVEQVEKGRAKWSALFASALVMLGAKAVWDLLKGNQ